MKKNRFLHIVGILLIFLHTSFAQNYSVETYYYLIGNDSTCRFHTAGLYDSLYYDNKIFKAIILDIRKVCVNSMTVIDIGYETKTFLHAKKFPFDSSSTIPLGRYDPSAPFIPLGRYYESTKNFYFHPTFCLKERRKKFKVRNN